MRTPRERYPWLAVTLSLLFPGLGQIYAGALLRGISFMAATFGLAYWAYHYLLELNYGLELFHIYVFLTLFVYLFSLVISYTSARSYNRYHGIIPSGGKDPWFAVFLSFIIPGLGHLYSKRYVAAIIVFSVWCGLQVAVFYLLWLFPVLPVYTVMFAVHAHMKTPGSRERRQGLVFMTIVGIAVLLAGSDLVMKYGGEVIVTYGNRSYMSSLP